MKTSAELAAARRPVGSHPPGERLRRYQAITIVFVFGALLIVCIGWSLVQPDFRFASVGNLSVLAQQIPVTAIAAIGVGLLMIAGEFDIGIPGTFTLVPFIVAITSAHLGWPLPVALLAGLVVALAIGLMNG